MTITVVASRALEILDKPRILTGFGYGFSCPVVIIDMAVPALPKHTREGLWQEMFGLLVRMAPPVASPPPEVAKAEEDDGDATISWIAALADQIVTLAGIPVEDRSVCIRLDPGTVRLAVPVLIRCAQQFENLLASALDFLSRPTGDQKRSEIGKRFTDMYHSLLASVRMDSNSPRLLRAAFQNKIAVQEMPGSNLLQYGLGRRARLLQGTFTQDTSLIGARLARQKHQTAALLRRNLLPAPAHGLATSEEHALELAKMFGFPLVVKPADLDNGRGVSGFLNNSADLIAAYQVARTVSDNVLVEKFVPGKDYRLYVIQGKFVWAVERQPGGVTGNGIMTIEELVAEANRDPRRGNSPKLPLKFLSLDDEAMALLRQERRGPRTVPKIGEFVRLRRIANISRGGMPVAVTEKVHADNAELAVRAAEAIKLDVAGIDLIIPDIAESWKHTGGAICEVNSEPEFGGVVSNHLYPLLLQSMLGGNGNIPVVCFLGSNKAEAMAQELARKLKAKGVTAGWHSRSGAGLGRKNIHDVRVSELAAGRMLSGHRDVDVLVFGATSSDVLRHGFPVPRIDILVLTGEPVEPGQAGPNLPGEVLAVDVLRLLAPAAEMVAVADEGAGVCPAITQALRQVGCSVQTLGPSKVGDLVLRMHRSRGGT